MHTSAIIYAPQEPRRKLLAQRISDLKIFDQLYFCATLQEFRTLLKGTPVDIVFCEHDHPKLPQKSAPQWIDLIREGQCRLICFTNRSSDNHIRLPRGSCYLHERIDNAGLADTVQSLLDQPLEGPPPVESRFSEYATADHQKIYSRFYFDTFVAKELSRSRLTGRPLSLLLIEPLFRFELPGNDPQLEPLLARITQSIKAQIRSSDLLCRYQRQRLAILLPETAPDKATELLERILATFTTGFSGQTIFWSSAVVSPTDSYPESAQGFLQKALTRLEQSQAGH